MVLLWGKKRELQAQMAVQKVTDFVSEQLQDAVEDLSGQANSVLEQLNKLGRLQHKNGRESSEHLQKLLTGVEELLRDQAERQRLELRIAQLEDQVNGLLAGAIRWLDDLDVLSDSLQGAAREVWWPMLRQWTERLLMQLEESGVRELPVAGAAFNPKWSEAVGVVEQAQAPDAQPYEVVKVVRRGYLRDNGMVLRKAQVMTVKGENVSGN